MTTENGIGIQTRAMTEAQHMEDGAQRQLVNNPEQVQGATHISATGQGTLDQGATNPAMNSTVDLHKSDNKVIKEFVRTHGAIGLGWYVPNFSNT